MKLIHRFAYYIGGLGIGVLIVIFFLGGQKSSCTYFPNARVLKEIRFRHQVIGTDAKNFFTAQQIDTVVIDKLLRQGKVDFDKSDTDRDAPCRVYVIDGKHRGKTLEINVRECKEDTLAVISKARFKKNQK